MMNNYQAQQLNSIIGFFTSIMFMGLVVGTVKSISVEEPKRYWLVYVTPEGKWGAWDITPAKPTLAIHKEDPKKYLKVWGEHYYRDAEAQVERGRFAKYWLSEAATRYRAIRNVQVMALPEHHSVKKVIEPFNIHLDAFWEYDLKMVERMIRKLDVDTLKKLYGSTIIITDKPMFPHPVTGEPMVGDTRYFREKPYLIILGSKPTPRIFYHEVAHYIGIDNEEEAMNFAKQKEEEFNRNQ